MTDAAARLERVLAHAPATLKLISEEESCARADTARWSKKEMLGHLIDSASNNHQRFLRALLTPAVEFPGYAQDEWVQAQQYQARPWSELIGLWTALNRHLLALVSANPSVPPALLDDYVRHLEHHLDGIQGVGADRAAELQALYRGEWWTNRRERSGTERMLAHTDEVIAIRDPAGGELIGFARVLTDRAYKALILDVIVKKSARGQGLGRRLVEAILAHPSLAAVRHFELYCLAEMAPFYRKWGFTSDLGDLRFMRLTR